MALTPSATPTLAHSRGLAVDARALDQLKHLAGQDANAAIRETARQFEALFMKELLKSMREATMQSGLMGGEESDLGTQLLDEQWAVKMSGLPGGLSEMIERQLSQQVTPAAVPAPAQGSGAAAASGASAAVSRSAHPAQQAHPAPQGPVMRTTPTQAAFVEQHRQAAQQVSRESGIPASFMIGKAAHETGWGRSPIRNADGSNSHNLFGIKATPGWRGRVAEITTTEYFDGVPRHVTARFRAYDSFTDAFRDYARLISQSPRYAPVMQQLHSPQAFAHSVQQAGYATDPRYAEKLSRVINTTLQIKRAQQG